MDAYIPRSLEEFERMTRQFWAERYPEADDVTLIVRIGEKPVRTVQVAINPRPDPLAEAPAGV